MDDHAEVERLLAEGYLVEIDGLALSKLNEEGAIFFSRVSTGLTPETLLDPSNRDKFLLRLIHPSTGHRVELLSSDELALNRAKEQYRYQKEPVGTLIRARCAALGGTSSSQRVFHLDTLVTSLDGLWGWRFTLGDVLGTLEVQIRLESTDRGAAEESLEKLQRLLDYLAVTHEVGFHIQHHSFESIPRCTELPYFGAAGPEEMMVAPVTRQDIHNIEATLSSAEAKDAARGLNEAYIENTMASRLLRLWAAAEGLFGSKAERLLTKEEVRHLVHAAKSIESLIKEPDRLRKLKDALSNPLQLSLRNRNRVMAEAIAPIMGISVDDAYSKVRTASVLCGKHRHKLLKNAEGIEASEKFLQEALRRYLTQQRTS